MKRAAMLMIAVALLLPMVVGAQTTTMPFTYTTTAPTTGNPVVTYEWQYSPNAVVAWIASGTSTGLSKVINLPVGVACIVRVRGIDALGQAGAWSPVADPNTPNAGPPGACGKPSWL
jgi:hypothetical protein